ncbi:MAG TPA: ATP-binding protein [Thermoanaerobaculia bacterium]|nr:ATP-binding protein [Thermoanaerobaculia bacterium]
MFDRLPPAARNALTRFCQVAVTFAFFALFNKIALYFEVENGVSILFPGTAIAILACMSFGVWAAIGVVLGCIATPWSPAADLYSLFVSGVICAIEGMIPWAVFRYRRDLTVDLRDMKSLVAFLVSGTILNTGVSAILGNLFVLSHPAGTGLVWREVFVWWIADFTAALLLALPALAFGGALLSRLLRNVRPEQPRTITNALQIVSIVILLGFAASFAIRMYLFERIEIDRLDQHRAWSAAEETINRLHANVLRAAFVDRSDANAATKLEAARRTNEKLIRDLSLLLAATPSLRHELSRVPADATEREILALRGRTEQANAHAWTAFEGKRRKIMIVAAMVDAMGFCILVLASAILLYNVSRPFAQLRRAIHAMREGEPVDAAQVDSRYLEFQSVAATLEETARELRRREEELRLQTAKAVRASQHKSDFLAKMSHELRTPLNSIIGFSDLLAEQDESLDSAKRLNFLGNVANSARHLLKLINDLLDIAKVESGKMKMHFENVDLRLAIAHTVASTQPLFVRKKQPVEMLIPEEPMLVRADLSRIEQVLLNLLSNANKFSAEGRAVAIRSCSDANDWMIEVTDHGIGISAADQHRIFDEFEQVHARGAHSAGTGLGLALAKRFVEAHGGDLGVESTPGAGSTFRVRLPRVVGVRS